MKSEWLRAQGILTAGVLLIMAALYVLLSYWTPFAYDDWVFMAEWRNSNGSGGLTPENLYGFWANIRESDNGRLANTLSPATTLFSPWKEIFPLFTGILAALIIYASDCIAFPERRNRGVLTLIVAWGFILLLPWRNCLFVRDYSLNYIWAAAVTLGFMIAVLRSERTGWNPVRFAAIILLALIAGAWHEGFVVATLAGFIILCFRNRGNFSWQWYVVGIVYALIGFLFAFSPGLLNRADEQAGVAAVGQNPLVMAFDFLPVIFLILIIALFLVTPRLRGRLKEAWRYPWFVVGSGIVVVGTALSLLFTHEPRSAFWPDLFAVIMTLFLLRPIVYEIIGRGFSGYIASLGFVVCAFPLAEAIIWQHKLYEEEKVIMAKYSESESGTVFHDIIPPNSIPIYALKLTNHPAWVSDFNFHGIKEFYGKPFTAVVPPTLDTVDEEKAKPLGGNLAAMKVEGNIVTQGLLSSEPKVAEADLTLADGSEASSVILILPFMTTDGEIYTYIYPYTADSEDISSISVDSPI